MPPMTKNTTHIEAGVNYCDLMNNTPGFWATMEVLPREESNSIVRVFVGWRGYPTGNSPEKYATHKAVTFYVDKHDGLVKYYEHYNN